MELQYDSRGPREQVSIRDRDLSRRVEQPFFMLAERRGQVCSSIHPDIDSFENLVHTGAFHDSTVGHAPPCRQVSR